MAQEVYKIKCPEHIVFGDPMYFERFRGEMLQRLVVDYRPPANFEARLKLYQDTVDGFDVMGMHLYLAPAETVGVYADDMMYEGQSVEERRIGVDTARYRLAVDGREQTIRTGGDGYWGSVTKFTRGNGEQKVTDAVVVDIGVPDEFFNFEEMRALAKSFFGDLEAVIDKNAALKQNKPSIREQLNSPPQQEPKTDAPKRSSGIER